MSFAAAERIADAVLFEGYVLYPYRASAAKNQLRWQFGVLVPVAHGEELDGAEPSRMQTECVLESWGDTELHLRFRFLHVQARTVEETAGDSGAPFTTVHTARVDERELVTWDEGIPHACDVTGVRLEELLSGGREISFHVPGSREVEDVADGAGRVRARVVRERRPLRVLLAMRAERFDAWIRLRATVTNATDTGIARGAPRDLLLRESLVGAHALIGIRGGAFVSLVDPPAAAAGAVSACVNRHTWPALVGPEDRRDLILSAPIILPDYPSVAPESPGDLYDGTEIDEILTLRIMTLTEDEKRQARATDERARRIIDRSEQMAPGALARLHGTVRHRADSEGGVPAPLQSVTVGGVPVARGSHVRLRPRRRADAMDMFLTDRPATVVGVYRDYEDRTYVAVTLDDDPSAELRDRTGRYYYFHPDEVQPLDAREPAGRTRHAPEEEQ